MPEQPYVVPLLVPGTSVLISVLWYLRVVINLDTDTVTICYTETDQTCLGRKRCRHVMFYTYIGFNGWLTIVFALSDSTHHLSPVLDIRSSGEIKLSVGGRSGGLRSFSWLATSYNVCNMHAFFTHNNKCTYVSGHLSLVQEGDLVMLDNHRLGKEDRQDDMLICDTFDMMYYVCGLCWNVLATVQSCYCVMSASKA